MDLSWCPGCDCQVFALESLYCSEACKRKDETSSYQIDNSYYYTPHCSLRKVRRLSSPFISLPTHTSSSSSIASPKLNPSFSSFSFFSPTISTTTTKSKTNTANTTMATTTTSMSDMIYLNDYLSERDNYEEENNKLNHSPTDLLVFGFNLSLTSLTTTKTSLLFGSKFN